MASYTTPPHAFLFQPWECQDFLRTWDAETPGADIPDLRLLEGIAVMIESKCHKSCSSDGSATLQSYHYLPCEELSSNLQVMYSNWSAWALILQAICIPSDDMNQFTGASWGTVCGACQVHRRRAAAVFQRYDITERHAAQCARTFIASHSIRGWKFHGLMIVTCGVQ